MFSGTGFGGIIAPIVVEQLLSKYGSRTTLIALAIFHFLILGPLIPFLKGRLPATITSEYKPLDLKHLKSWLFFAVCLANFVQALSYFIPLIYLPC